VKNGITLISGGTENHLLLIDLRPLGLSGKEMENRLGLAGLTVNKNTIPFDPQGPMVTSGIRIGTAALTSRKMGGSEMEKIADWISAILKDAKNDRLLSETRSRVKDLCARFPLY
jgi:glycine hydroxymethyltransferase